MIIKVSFTDVSLNKIAFEDEHYLFSFVLWPTNVIVTYLGDSFLMIYDQYEQLVQSIGDQFENKTCDLNNSSNE